MDGFSELPGRRRLADLTDLRDLSRAEKLVGKLSGGRFAGIWRAAGIWPGRRSDPLGNLQKRSTRKYLHRHPVKTLVAKTGNPPCAHIMPIWR